MQSLFTPVTFCSFYDKEFLNFNRSINSEMTIEYFLFELEFYMDFGGDNDYFDKKLRGFWCDGISPPSDTEEFRRIIDDNGYIELPIYF